MDIPIIYMILLMFFGVFTVVATVAFEKWHQYSQAQQLKSLVAWSIIPDHPFLDINGHEIPLWSYISNSQIQLNLPQEYRISGDNEWVWAKEIIDEYQNNLVLSYFKGDLTNIRSNGVIKGEAYFMNALQYFLKKHQCDYKFLGYDMHKERVEHKQHGDWGGPCYDATFSLTDFAIVFHKLYYIAYLYCKNNKTLNPVGDAYRNDDFIKRVLDTQKLKVWAGT